RARRSAAGFTLLEMLIAITLLGIMMTLLFGSLRTCVRSWEAGEKLAAKTGRMAVIESFIRTYLSNAMPLIDDLSEEDPVFSFKGTDRSVQFVSSLPASAGRGGLYIFNLDLVNDGREKVLQLTLRPFYPLFDEAQEVKEEIIILENIEEMKLAYFGEDIDLDEEDRWHEKWEERDSLPKLVQVELTIEGEAPWPTLYVAPRLDVINN
ncbi:MAG: prepilin-type N-terminal cleavage/methylation domain-containing protein, partial [Pseudomonadota bacterium]